ncbi:MAG: tryptophan-rich sensory protein [Proteobacteria bacterium]|nr:tryptophan-rich sensory protein [Pseudomonadota bacterium]
MTELASPGQLRASYLRWALVLVPGILLLGLLAAAFAGNGVGDPWFYQLTIPEFYPPPAVFEAAWALIYVLMGLSAAGVVTARGAPGRGAALGFFAAQLVLSFGWAPLFFAMHRMSVALGLLVVVDLLAAVAVWRFWRIRPVAGALLLICLIWLLFVTALNWQFLDANPDADGRATGHAAATVNFN